jgi:hypothetical protein
MSDLIKGAGIIILVLVFALGLGWIVQGNDFFMYKVFAPQYENTRRQVFENSKAFNQGMVQELQNMQFEYIRASPEHKAALASVIIHRAADYNLDQPQVPSDLRNFIVQLKSDSGARY